MSTRKRKTDESFLDSILADPLEDIHRLVYADWLEEHGDPRGEFVRLAVGLGEGDAEARCREMQPRFDPWWAVTVLAPSQVRRLRRLAESRFGPLDALY